VLLVLDNVRLTRGGAAEVLLGAGGGGGGEGGGGGGVYGKEQRRTAGKKRCSLGCTGNRGLNTPASTRVGNRRRTVLYRRRIRALVPEWQMRPV